MGSDSTPRLPVIDFSTENLERGTQEWKSLRDQVREALEEYGCFEAKLDQVPLEARNKLFNSMKELFDLPLETKKKNVAKGLFTGYQGQSPRIPLYESLAIDEGNLKDNIEEFTNIIWPEGNIPFSQTIQYFSQKVSDLDQTISTMIFESFGLDKHIDEYIDSTNFLLRFTKYEGPDTTETKLGLEAHADSNMLTILHQNEINGLEMQAKDGTWLKPSPGSFTIMVGESLYGLLNGRLPAAIHRVMMNGKTPRYSFGLFFKPKKGYVIKVPEEIVDKDHPLLFKPFNHMEYTSFRYSEAGAKAEFALKAFCGV